MVRTDKLRGLIAENGMSQCGIAKRLGISAKTFYAKVRKGIFNSDEIQKMIVLLHIDNPTEIFFADIGTNCVPNDKENGQADQK